jgi:hypothetical protein
VSSEASFVFQGSVVAVGTATLAMVDADDLTAVVRVDRVLRAPEQMEHIAGREITVQLREPADVGTSAIFEADGWLYGASMAVREVGRRRPAEDEPAEAAADEDAGETAAAADRAEAFRDALEARAAEASAVVVGRVTGVKETAAPTEGRLSEHDPQWAVATVEVDEAVKGGPPRTVDVMFATSEDVMWRDAPKLNVGQKAVMLLQKGAPEVEEKRAHAVVDPLDVQPADTAELVAELVERKPTRRRRR